MNALASIEALPAAPKGDFYTGAPALSSFQSVPSGCDVTPMGGMVAIFDVRWSEIQEGGYYVVESQHPVGGMSWETCDQINRSKAPADPRVRLKTARRVVRATRRETTSGAWWFVQEGGFQDGPIADWAVGYNVVGEVVGIYRPDAG